MPLPPEMLEKYPGLRPITETENWLAHSEAFAAKQPYLRVLRVVTVSARADSTNHIEQRIKDLNALHSEVRWAAQADREGAFQPPLMPEVSEQLQQADEALELIGTYKYKDSDPLTMDLMNITSLRLLSLVAMCGFVENS